MPDGKQKEINFGIFACFNSGMWYFCKKKQKLPFAGWGS